MKFWNIIIIFAYIYAFMLKSVVRLVPFLAIIFAEA